MIDWPSKANAWISGLLLLSLATNCLLAGVLLGREASWFGEGAARVAVPGAPADGFGGRVQLLPTAERDKFMAAMKPARPQIRAARRQMIEARRRIGEAILHDPYDAAATAAALAELRRRTTDLQQLVQDAAAQAVAVLSPAARRQLVGPAPGRRAG